MAWRWSWLRLVSWVYRFRTLPHAERAFAGAPSPCILRRPLFGFSMAVDVSRAAVQRLLFLEGERFIGERFLLSRLVSKGDTAVDVGANIGYYLLLLARLVGSEGKVIAVEPSRENLPELKRNIAENKLSNVELHEVAAGSERGTVGFMSGINGRITTATATVDQVPLVPLDDIISTRVDFLKMDVEGAEGRALAGAQELVRRWHPVIFVEIHPHMLGAFGDTTRGVMKWLRAEYDSVEIYENVESRLSAWGKIAVRYACHDPVQRIENPDEFLVSMDVNPPACTFWAVAQNGKKR
ncbi:MAG: FkbM family methyltransferase [Kiritimatiellia bacterium]|nr:FkbM family methyltransferase [Kiritimatiellia bacterium]